MIITDYLLAAILAVRGALLATTAKVMGEATALLTSARSTVAHQRARIERIGRVINDHPLPKMAARVPEAARRLARMAVLTYAAIVAGIVPSWTEYVAFAYAGGVIAWHFYKAWREKPIVDAAEPLWGRLRTAWSHP